MSAFRFYSVLAAVAGLVVWMSSLYSPHEAPTMLTFNQAYHPAPAQAGIDRIAQGFER